MRLQLLHPCKHPHETGSKSPGTTLQEPHTSRFPCETEEKAPESTTHAGCGLNPKRGAGGNERVRAKGWNPQSLFRIKPAVLIGRIWSLLATAREHSTWNKRWTRGISHKGRNFNGYITVESTNTRREQRLTNPYLSWTSLPAPILQETTPQKDDEVKQSPKRQSSRQIGANKGSLNKVQSPSCWPADANDASKLLCLQYRRQQPAWRWQEHFP